jgi:hypothetical protein
MEGKQVMMLPTDWQVISSEEISALRLLRVVEYVMFDHDI